MSILNNFIIFFKDIIAPKKCYSCQKEGHFLCNKCFEKQENFSGYCYICKRKSPNFTIHKKCLIENKLLGGKNFNSTKLYLDGIIVLTHYKNPVIKKLIIAFKFFGKKSIGRELSQRLEKLIINSIKSGEEKCGLDKNATENKHIILPVPLHFIRKLSRGFNQSEIIAQNLAKALDLEYNKSIISRRIYTRHQSQLSRDKRLNNLDNAFKISKNKRDIIDKKNIFLIDDVVSSGTTLNEIAKLLKKYGAQKVTGVCLASD